MGSATRFKASSTLVTLAVLLFALSHVPSVILVDSVENQIIPNTTTSGSGGSGNGGGGGNPSRSSEAGAGSDPGDPEETVPKECASEPNYIYPNPKNCSTFFKCWRGKLYPIPCPEPLVFNTELLLCDWRWNVTTCDKDPIDYGLG